MKYVNNPLGFILLGRKVLLKNDIKCEVIPNKRNNKGNKTPPEE